MSGTASASARVGAAPERPPAWVQLYWDDVFAGGGEPAATDLDVFGGAVPADGVYGG